MALRVSQQYVNVLTNRATGTIVDADNTLTFTQVATGTTNNVKATSTINFTQLATGIRGFLRVSQQYATVLSNRESGTLAETSSTIVFVQSAVGTTNNVNAESTIGFTQVATGTNLSVDVESVINFGSEAGVDSAPGNTINFIQSAVAQAGFESGNTISFSHSAHAVRSGVSTVSFVQLAEFPRSGENTIVFSQLGEPVRDPTTRFGVSQFVISQAAVKLHDATRDYSQTINFQQSATYEVDRSSNECLYTPFVGAGAVGNPTPPPSTLAGPDEVISQGLQLRYPAGSSPSEIVTLTRSMNIGDIDRLGFDRISRESRGKTLNVFADDQWPKTETILFTVSAVCRDDAVLALDFIEDHIAEEIGLLTHEGRLWRGVIMNPDEAIVEDRTDSFTINLELEGEHDAS